MTAIGIALIVIGIVLIFLQPRLKVEAHRGKIRGIGGPILIVLGILMLTGVIQ